MSSWKSRTRTVAGARQGEGRRAGIQAPAAAVLVSRMRKTACDKAGPERVGSGLCPSVSRIRCPYQLILGFRIGRRWVYR